MRDHGAAAGVGEGSAFRDLRDPGKESCRDFERGDHAFRIFPRWCNHHALARRGYPPGISLLALGRCMSGGNS